MNRHKLRKKNGVLEINRCYLCNNKAQIKCKTCKCTVCNDCYEKQHKMCYKCYASFNIIAFEDNNQSTTKDINNGDWC